MEKTRPKSAKNGRYFVIALIGLAILGALLTQWNYTKTNFSTREAWIEAGNGAFYAVAPFPLEQAARIRPEMMAIVTLNEKPKEKIEAFVEELEKETDGKIRVRVRLPGTTYPAQAKCEVTVDASVSPEMLKARTIPRQ